jgi:hypothetical protein
MHVAFREGNRLDAALIQFGEIAVPNQSDHIYLVATRPGQDRPAAASIAFSADQDDPESNPSSTQIQPWGRIRLTASIAPPFTYTCDTTRS